MSPACVVATLIARQMAQDETAGCHTPRDKFIHPLKSHVEHCKNSILNTTNAYLT